MNDNRGSYFQASVPGRRRPPLMNDNRGSYFRASLASKR
jgi:hypothetical protein